MITTTLEAIWAGGVVAIGTVGICRYAWLAREHYRQKTLIAETVDAQMQALRCDEVLTEAYLEADRRIQAIADENH